MGPRRQRLSGCTIGWWSAKQGNRIDVTFHQFMFLLFLRTSLVKCELWIYEMSFSATRK